MADVKILEPVLLAALARQGIAANDVELRCDYAPRSRGKGYSPYARSYRDIVSGKHFSMISGLPMVDAWGQSPELRWSDRNGVIENGNNIFHSVIDKGTMRLIALSDQPFCKKDDDATYQPQLFIGGAEIKPLSELPKLLETDPSNENYHNNVLEWDYGVCLRRVRLIEGRFLGSWVFVTAPKGDVLIKYNQSGKLRLRLQYAQDEDTEFIPKAFFDQTKEYPVTICDSATFYPDPDPETATVDGYPFAYEPTNGYTWANLRTASGYNAYSNESSAYMLWIRGNSAATNYWTGMSRTAALFDSSSLPDDCTITDATVSFYGMGKSDLAGNAPSVNVYSVTLASNTNVVAADYAIANWGSTAFCDTPITYAGWSTTGYNAFVLNATGIAAISKTGISKFGFRNANYDVGNSEPPNKPAGLKDQYMGCYFSEQGAGYQPKLVVTYSTGITEKSSAETGSGAEAKTSGHPIVVTSGTEIGSGSESLGSRDLAKSETGSGLESLGSRALGKNETASGQDAASLFAAFTGSEAGSGLEAALRAVALLSGDAGLGAELSWMLKDALAGDTGSGDDALKALKKTADATSEMRLSGRAGQAGMPSRQVKMPSKGVNL